MNDGLRQKKLQLRATVKLGTSCLPSVLSFVYPHLSQVILKGVMHSIYLDDVEGEINSLEKMGFDLFNIRMGYIGTADTKKCLPFLGRLKQQDF